VIQFVGLLLEPASLRATPMLNILLALNSWNVEMKRLLPSLSPFTVLSEMPNL
jgi:hypothetical protein